MCAVTGFKPQLHNLLAVILVVTLSFVSLSFLVCIWKIVVCLLPWVVMRPHDDAACDVLGPLCVPSNTCCCSCYEPVILEQ